MSLPKLSLCHYEATLTLLGECQGRLATLTPTTFSGDILQQMAQELSIPLGVGHETVLKSSLDMLDKPFTKETLDSYLLRLCANRRRLQEGKPVFPWVAQLEPEYVGCEILEARKRYRTGIAEQRYCTGLLELRSLQGQTAGMTLTHHKSWGTQLARRTDFGFSNATARHFHKHGQFVPFVHPRQLVGLRVYALLDPERSSQSPYISGIKITKSQRDYNRALILSRMPTQRTCPRSYTWDCHLCAIGKEHCGLACHQKDYLARACPRCREHFAWFEKSSDPVCADCMVTYQEGT